MRRQEVRPLSLQKTCRRSSVHEGVLLDRLVDFLERLVLPVDQDLVHLPLRDGLAVPTVGTLQDVDEPGLDLVQGVKVAEAECRYPRRGERDLARQQLHRVVRNLHQRGSRAHERLTGDRPRDRTHL